MDQLNPNILQELRQAEEMVFRGELYPNNQEAQKREFLAQAKVAIKFALEVLDAMERKLPPDPNPQPRKRKKATWKSMVNIKRIGSLAVWEYLLSLII